jgi:hypothetical protein
MYRRSQQGENRRLKELEIRPERRLYRKKAKRKGGISVDGMRVMRDERAPSMGKEVYPRGWVKRETSISTAVADAMAARPGRETVHIWSSVRSLRDWMS